MNGNETTNMPSRNTIRWRVLPALAFLLLLAPGPTPATAFEGFKHPKASQLQCRTACHQPENLQQARQDKFAKPECRQCHTGESPAQAGGLFRSPGAVIQFEDTVPNRRQLSARPPVRAAQNQAAAQTGAPSGKPPEGMAYVPAGEFIMGSNERWDDESPEHISETGAFYIDLHEVTNAGYKKFVDATGHEAPHHWPEGKIAPGKENHPVIYVNWFDAHDYCEWNGKRLPDEREWEKAARGEDGRLYPWGNVWSLDRSNNPYKGSTGTEPVGSYENGKSPYGLFDMSGNVWEWVDAFYLPHPGNDIPKPEYGRDKRVLKGGSWFDCLSYGCGLSAPTFNRSFFNPEVRNNSFGFRCATNAGDSKTAASKQ